MEIFQIVVLSFSGLALVYACSMRLINPAKAVFLQSYFEDPANNLDMHIGLVNEIRGVGAVMLMAGIIAEIGIISSDFRIASFTITTLILSGVVFGRLTSLVLDGIPHKNLIRVIVAEGVLAALNAVCLINILSQGGKV
ncbi:MAG: DUF4345 domain-containing protein [Bacteroidia bacterium]|nr:DUF4345 domain-containing protein [Bacteroidia bacterium]